VLRNPTAQRFRRHTEFGSDLPDRLVRGAIELDRLGSELRRIPPSSPHPDSLLQGPLALVSRCPSNRVNFKWKRESHMGI
jgi:hypothetical protein